MITICGGAMRTGSVAMFQIMREIVDSTGTGFAPYLTIGKEDEEFSAIVKDWALSPQIIVLKLHRWRDELEEYMGHMRVVMTIRDLRDVVVSLMNFREANFESTMASAALRGNVDAPLEWKEKLASRQLYVVYYFRLIHDRVTLTKDIGRFMGVKLSSTQAFAIEQKWNRSANLKRAIAEHPLGSPEFMAKRHIGGFHPGQYHYKLTKDQIREVEQYAPEWFDEFGYIWKQG